VGGDQVEEILEKMGKISVLGISGSPRNGNSLFLLEEALEAATQVNEEYISTELYSMKAKKMGPCVGCFKCSREDNLGECVIRDDFQDLRDLWLGSDVILYSVPVYHLNIPGQLKCFIDRLGNTINKYYNLPSPRFLKVIGALAQGMHFSGGQELTISFLIQHAVLKNCIPVAGDGWQSYIGAGGWTQCKRETDSIKTQFENGDSDAQLAVQASRSVGQRATEVALILRTGGAHLREILSDDSAYNPFLYRLPNP